MLFVLGLRNNFEVSTKRGHCSCGYSNLLFRRVTAHSTPQLAASLSYSAVTGARSRVLRLGASGRGEVRGAYPREGPGRNAPTSSTWPFSRSPWSRFNDAASSRLMTSRSVAVSACPACKILTIAFSKIANERASVVAAYLRVFDEVAIIQVRFHHSASLAQG